MVTVTAARKNLALTVLLVSIFFTLPTTAQQGFQLPDDVAERTADIFSEGTRLTAHIFTPKAAATDEKLPAVILAQGWGGTQSSLFWNAARLARFSGYNPAAQLKLNDTVALQIVLAENKEYGTNPGAMEVYEHHDGPKNLVVIPDIKHYDIYTVARQQARDLAVSWFDRHLK